MWTIGLLLTLLGFCLGVGQPLSMTTVVQAAPDEARSTALALRLTGNRLGQVAAPAAAGLVAGVMGAAAPFVLLGALLLLSAGVGGALAGAVRGGRTGGGGAGGGYGIAPHERSLTARRTSVPWEEAAIAQSPDKRWICMKII